MNRNNFGKSRAGELLSDILFENNYPKITKKVTRVYNEYMESLNALDGAGGITLTKKIKMYLLNLIHNDNETKVRFHFDKNIRDFLLNIFDAEYKKRLAIYKTYRLNEKRRISKNAIIASKQQLEINKNKQ